MRPISPHQTHSLGLSVDTNTQTHRLNDGGKRKHTHTQVKIKEVGGENNRGKKCNRQLRKAAAFSSHRSSEMSVDRSKGSWAVTTEIRAGQRRTWRKDTQQRTHTNHFLSSTVTLWVLSP